MRTFKWSALLIVSAVACAQPRTPQPLPPAAHAGPGTELRIASWNLEWLSDPAVLTSSGYWDRCRDLGWPNQKLRADLPFCDVYHLMGIDFAEDYAARKLVPVRQGLAALAARKVDLLAVEEVQRSSALAAVLPTGYRVVCFTQRPDAQNVGYAMRIASGLSPTCREIVALSLEHDPEIPRPVRRGLELDVHVNGATLSLLNVHLKSGCSRGRMDAGGNDACLFLQHQARPLEDWVESRATAGAAFAVIGDWNRDLEEEWRGHYPARSDGSDPRGPIDPAKVRNLLPEINDGAPPASAMSLARVDRSAAASGCFATLDQLVVSERLRHMLDASSLTSGRVAARLIAGPPGASDHCALEAVLRWRAR